MATSIIQPLPCGTRGCTNTGHGISIAVSRPSIYRCHDCRVCLNALAPGWTRGVTRTSARQSTKPETDVKQRDAVAVGEAVRG